jgi:hypothetical protein
MSAPTPKPQPSNFTWYELHTFDSDSAAAFYAGVLGWSTNDAAVPGRRYTLVSAGDAPVGGLLEKPANSFADGAKPAWVGYIGVDDLDTYSKRVEQAGGMVHRAAEDIPGVGRFAVVADPQGAIFVLFQPNAQMAQSEVPPAAKPGSVAWHELIAADWPSAFAFYAGLFGWSKADAIDMGSAGVYQIFTAGSAPIGGMMAPMGPAAGSRWLFYFRVAGIEAAMALVKQHGGTVVDGPSPVPGGEQIAHCLDPQGAMFGMVSREG